MDLSSEEVEPVEEDPPPVASDLHGLFEALIRGGDHPDVPDRLLKVRIAPDRLQGKTHQPVGIHR